METTHTFKENKGRITKIVALQEKGLRKIEPVIRFNFKTHKPMKGKGGDNKKASCKVGTGRNYSQEKKMLGTPVWRD